MHAITDKTIYHVMHSSTAKDELILASYWQITSFLPQIYGIFNIHLPLLGHSINFFLQKFK